MSELKPCPNPWCEVSAPELYRGGFRNRNVRVQCETCGIHAQSSEFEAKAITAWNTRPREAELEAEVAALGAQVRSAAEAAQVVWSGEHARLEAEVGRLREGVRRALTYMDPMSPGHSSHKMADARRVLQTAISHPKGADE